VNKDKKPLSETHPELAKEADGWDPKTVVAGTGKKLKWKCKQGHTWESKGSSRKSGTGCPICSNHKVLVGYNDLATTNPDLAKEADGWDPETVVAGSDKKMQWKCKQGHTWETTVSSRKSGTGCPICSNHKVLAGYNDLATTNPDLAEEAFGWDPKQVLSGSDKKMQWKCKQGHTWNASSNDRTTSKTGCPVCSNQKVLAGFNDLATTHPELAKEADGWDPKTVVAGTRKKLKWKCKQGHTWEATCSSRKSGSGCPVCTNLAIAIGFNDLATTHPELAKEADGWDPKTVVAGSKRKLKWKCKQGHTWESALYSRSSLQKGCPYCTNQKVLAGYNDLATTHPALAKEAFGWDPKTVVAGSGRKLKWKCKQGHTWTSLAKHRQHGSGCPTCANRILQVGYNDLATTHPALAKEAFGWDPKTVIAGTNKKLIWKCLNGHVWTSIGSNRVFGRGCPSCAQTGYDPNQNGYLYFLIHPKWEIFQIGITNFPEDRLKTHLKTGFELLELRGPIDGHTAQELETAMLRFLKSQKADLSPDHVAGKFDGYSESWTIDSYKVNNLKELIDKASEAGF
jgi:hypothetical protein